MDLLISSPTVSYDQWFTRVPESAMDPTKSHLTIACIRKLFFKAPVVVETMAVQARNEFFACDWLEPWLDAYNKMIPQISANAVGTSNRMELTWEDAFALWNLDAVSWQQKWPGFWGVPLSSVTHSAAFHRTAIQTLGRRNVVGKLNSRGWMEQRCPVVARWYNNYGVMVALRLETSHAF